MKQNLTLHEMQAALRMARITPASYSPLAGVHPAAELDRGVLESLRQKGIWDGAAGLVTAWRDTLATLAEPMHQVTAYIEGAGAATYYGGAGGGAAMVPVEGGQQRVLGELSADTILTEIDELLGWRSVPDGAPLRVDLSIDELATVAAIADSCREEQLRAVIERRPPVTGRVSRGDAERQITTGQSKPDPHWLVSILTRFAPQGCGPTVAALDAGASALMGRLWARPGDGCLELGPEIETLCAGFANLTPFLAIGSGAPWAEPAVSIFTRGLQSFWGIEFRSSGGRSWAALSRVGAKAMEEILRLHLAALKPAAAEPSRNWPVAQAAPPARPAFSEPVPAQPAARPPVSQPAMSQAEPSRDWRVAAQAAPPARPAFSEPVPAQPAPRPPVSQPAAVRPSAPVAAAAVKDVCAACGRPLKPGKKFCMSCGARVA